MRRTLWTCLVVGLAAGCDVPQESRDEATCSALCECYATLPSAVAECEASCISTFAPVSETCEACVLDTTDSCTGVDACLQICSPPMPVTRSLR